ncbi:MAG: dockerin type I repeat-containing protein [Ruminococcus sp.]|nr:dockerin type I repeat-containing protein [Ruminococcus sp.]
MKLFSKVTALVLAVAVSVSTGMTTAFSAQTEADSAPVCKGVYYSCSGNGISSDSADRMDDYVYSDDYFRAPSSAYNAHLASMSMAVSEASGSSSRAKAAQQSRNLTALLEDIGFADIAVNQDYGVKPTVNTAAVACAHKQITDGGKSYTLIALIPRSAGYGAELGNSVLFGTKGDAAGYSAASAKALSYLREYISQYGVQGDIKIWTAGFDRGAAIAALAAKSLIDNPKGALGEAVKLTPENLYAYTFGTPAAADSKQNLAEEKYSMIYHHISDADLLSAIPPAEMGFGRCGTVKIINAKANKKRMKQLLAVCSPEVYNDYVGGNNPDAFQPKRVTSSGSIVNDTGSYIPNDVSEYISGMSQYLARFNNGRSGFSAGAEQPLSAVLAYYGGLTKDKANTFVNSVGDNKDTINGVISMYAYFMKLKSSGQLLTSAQQKAALSAADAADFSDRELYEILLRLVRYKSSSADSILNDASGYLKNVLTAAMKESGATTTQISSVTATKNMKALSHFLSCLFFGNGWQSKETDPYNFLDNEQVKNAVTLLENAGVLCSDHRSEVLLSWLRANDSYYEDYAPMTDAQRTGYRRVYLTPSDGTSVSGEIFNAAGEKVAQISDGVLAESADEWIGYTAADNGGFLRLPVDEDYRMELRAGAAYTLGVGIDEYGCEAAKATTVLSESLEVPEKAVVTVNLPALAEGDAIPSDAAYTVTVAVPRETCILGDANGDGEITVDDVTTIQRHVAEMQLLNGAALVAADVNSDGTVTIDDATMVQRYLAEYEVDAPIGEPKYYT